MTRSLPGSKIATPASKRNDRHRRAPHRPPANLSRVGIRGLHGLDDAGDYALLARTWAEVISINADVRVGGAFRLRSQAPDGAIHTIDGEYRQLEPGRRIVMTWAYSGPVALICNMETLIEVDFEQIGDRNTTMTFTQSQFTTAEAADAYAGDWPSCFTKLDGAVGATANDKNKT